MLPRVQLRPTAHLATLALLALTTSASAIYIDPFPYQNVFDLGGTIPRAGRPYDYVATWGSDSGPANAFRGSCTASFLTSYTNPPKSFFLTAAHCAPALPAGRSYQVQMLGGNNTITLDTVSRHPDYATFANGPSRNDVAIARASVIPAGTNGIYIAGRTAQLAIDTHFYEPGIGTTGYDAGPPARNTGFGTPRDSLFKINAFNAQRDTFQAPRAGTGGMTPDGIDPFRHACPGDSGGPAVADGKIIGVEFSIGGGTRFALPGGGMGAACDGTHTRINYTNMTREKNYNFVDAYVISSFLIDKLRIATAQGVRQDGFEPAAADAGPRDSTAGYQYGENGYAPDWQPLSIAEYVQHPTLGTIGANPTGYRYMNAIGAIDTPSTAVAAAVNTSIGEPDPAELDPILEGQATGPFSLTAPDLYTEGRSSQGAILEGGGYSLIYKDFEITGGGLVQLMLDEHWNSLGIGSDLGVQLPDGTVIWDGLQEASMGDIDVWRTRTLEFDMSAFPGIQTVRVYSLITPEPASLSLLAIACGMMIRRRRAE